MIGILTTDGCTVKGGTFQIRIFLLCVWTVMYPGFFCAKKPERKEEIMNITGSIKEVRAQVKEWRRQGLTVGLVPTMGYLHEGHKSLIDRAVMENE